MSLWNNSEDFYKQYPSQLTDRLFIAAARAVTPKSLLDLGITCIVNATIELPTMAYQKQETLQIAVEDRIASSLYVYFDLVADKIHEIHQNGGKILVYCRAGQSRSAALCMAYFIKYHKLSFDDAFQYVKARRPIIHPNIGFVRQLKEFREKCKKAELLPPPPPVIAPPPLVNGNGKVVLKSNDKNNNVTAKVNGVSKKAEPIKPCFTTEEHLDVQAEQGAQEMEEIVLTSPDLAVANVHQDLKQVALRYDAHIIKFNESISYESHDDSNHNGVDHNSNHLINEGSSHEGIYPAAIMTKAFDISQSYSNIPLETELIFGEGLQRTKSVRKKKRVGLSKSRSIGNSADVPARRVKPAKAEQSICPINLILPNSKFDTTLMDLVSPFSGLPTLGTSCVISTCDTNLSVAQVCNTFPWLSVFTAPIPPSNFALTAAAKPCKAKMTIVGFDDQNPEACQISIVGHAGAHRLPPNKAVINPALGYAMKSIKPLNDRIKRLQKFAVKTAHVSASSGGGNNVNNEIVGGGFEKKSGNNFDLKNLNIAACRKGYNNTWIL